MAYGERRDNGARGLLRRGGEDPCMKDYLKLLWAHLVTPTNVKSLLVGLFAVAFSIALYEHGAFRGLDFYWLDRITMTTAPGKQDETRITLVEISDNTYEKLGSSIKREMYLAYLNKVRELGAKVIVFDLFLRGGTSDTISRKIRETALESGNVIFVINREGSSESNREPLSPAESEKRLLLVDPELHYDRDENSKIVRYITAYLRGPQEILNEKNDSVGAHGRTGYSALALEAVACYRGQEVEIVPHDPPGRRRPWYYPPGASARMGDDLYYLAGDRIYINYPRTTSISFTTVSFEDLAAPGVSQKLHAEDFKNRIIILGNTSNFYHDKHQTPSGFYDGLFIHGLIIRSLLDHQLPYPLNPAIAIACALLAGLISFAAFPRMKPLNAFALFLLTIASTLVCSIILYHYHRLFLEISPILTVLAICYPFMSLFKTRETEIELDTSLNIIEKMNIIDRSHDRDSSWLECLLELSCGSLDASLGWIQVVDETWAFRLEAAHNCTAMAERGDLEGGLCAQAMNKEKLLLSGNLKTEKKLSPYERRQEVFTLLCVPLLAGTRKIGVMAFGKKFFSEFKENQIKQVMAIAVITGAFIENVNLNRKLEKVFLDAIQSLAQAVEARDPYTYGHSSRVALFSEEIARRMNVPESLIEMIRMAGMLHDVGKIGVPEAILHKPGKLTEEEFALMQMHPEIGIKILEPLDQFYNLIPIVSGHHEKINGKGYPKGLKGKAIPIGARILAVADVYDALTSDRPYRKGSPASVALKIMDEQFASDLDSAAMAALRHYLRDADQIQ
jgi:HD-GYP domain-containing protein (c-di-GMP phosphodiesterase class II)/CHASE2 domain-containing sensor protein